MSMASLVHLADGTEKLAIRQALSAGRPGAALLEWLGELLPVLAAGLPVLILAVGMVRTGKAEDAVKKAGEAPHPWILRAAGIVALALSAVSLLVPALAGICIYLLAYLLLVAAFSLWEKLHDANPGLDAWGWILFGGCWLRAVERMMEVMSVYHL